MNCPRCNGHVKPASSFCPRCGNPLQSQSENYKWLLRGVFITLLPIIVLLPFFLFASSSSPSDATPIPPSPSTTITPPSLLTPSTTPTSSLSPVPATATATPEPNPGEFLFLKDKRIYIQDVNGLTEPLTPEDWQVDDATWSPDGSQIAFVRMYPHDSEIYILRMDGSIEPYAVIPQTRGGPQGQWAPSWSPDGQHLAFHAHGSGNPDIYTVRTDGGNLEQLTTHPSIQEHPEWSPDGRSIACVSNREGHKAIVIIALDSREVRRPTQTLTNEELPEWAPDGQRILFTRKPENTLYVMDIASGAKWPFSPAIENGGHLSWTPRGLLVGNGDIWFYADPDTGTTPRNLTNTPPEAGWESKPDLRP